MREDTTTLPIGHPPLIRSNGIIIPRNTSTPTRSMYKNGRGLSTSL